MLIATKMPVDERDAGSVLVVAGCFAFSLLGSACHLFGVKGKRTRTPLDRLFAWDRAGMARACVRGHCKRSVERVFFLQLHAGMVFGMLGVSSLLLMPSGDDDRLGRAAVACWLASLVVLAHAAVRMYWSVPERLEPEWPKEEEHRWDENGYRS